MRDAAFAIDAQNAVDGDADAPCNVTRGEPRFTKDLDFVANQQREHLRNLLP